MIIRNNVSAEALVNTASDGTVSILNPGGELVATGFPSEDFAHGWIHAALHFQGE